MDEAGVRTKKIEVEVDQKKMEYINYAYNEEMTYWKKLALAKVLNESEERELLDLAPSRVLLIRKEKIEKTVNIDEIIFYIKSMYPIIMKSQGLLLITFQPKSLPLKKLPTIWKLFQNISRMMEIWA